MFNRLKLHGQVNLMKKKINKNEKQIIYMKVSLCACKSPDSVEEFKKMNEENRKTLCR